MKKVMKSLLCIAMSLLLLCVGLPVWAIEAEPIRILAIGNSFSNNATYFISRIAESMGKDVSVVSLYYAGCTLKQHVEFYNSDSRSYQFYEDGVNLTTGQWQTMKEVFELYDYDYVTLQQSPSGSDVFSTYWTEENPWLTELYDIVTEHEPQAEVMVHQTWSFCHDCAIGNDPYWDTNYNNSKEMYDVIEDCYEQMADKIGVDKESGIIPVGKAIQLAKDEYGYGDFYNSGSGLTDATHCANGALYTDNVDHLNFRGRYIAGCVWLEKIFGYDCRTATYFPEGVLSEEECEILRNIAHEAVTGEKAYIEGDWRVLPDGDGVEIVHYMGTIDNEVGTLIVPDAINGKKVTRVDDTAFKYITGLNSLILPDDVTIVYEDGALDNYVVIEKVWDGTSSKPTKGDGTEESPYLIENASHLYWAVTNKNTGVYFKLTRDILINNIIVDTENGTVAVDENAHEWYLGGTDANNVFEGIIDGDFHVISGLYFDEDFNNTEQVWNIGAALIPRAGNGATIKNLGIENSYIKAIGGTAAAFIGTTGSGASNVITIENSYVGEDVYLYGDDAAAFIGAGNGSGYTNGITDCYSLATVGGTLYVGSITGGIWSGSKCPVTNVYTKGSKFYGQGSHTFTDCYSITEADLGSSTFMTKFANLGDSFTFAEGEYPVLKSWVGKSDKIWSGFAVNTLEGDGTESSPYLISDGEGLAYAILNCGTGKYYKLKNDIYLNDINAVNWETAEMKGDYVASSWLEEVTFNGYFDGDGFVVYGIYYPVGNGKEYETFRNAALFPLINSNTHIKNVGVRYSHIEVFGHASGIVGFIKRNDSNKNIVIDSCFADETNYIVHTRQNNSTECSSSGILGGTLFTPNIAISNCYSLANLSGPYNIAHIIGSTWQAPETVTAKNCYSVGKPWMNSSAAVSVKTIENCYSAAAPSDTYAVWTYVSDTNMQGANALTNMPLGNAFMVTQGYPVLKAFVALQYIVDGEIVKVAEGEDALETFIPEAPDCKYFAGWYTDEEYTKPFVTTELPLGETKVYAKLNAYDTYVKNDFDSYVGSASYYQILNDGTIATKFDRYGWTYKENANGVDYYYSNRTWAQGGSVLLMNEDGSLFVADPSKKYKVTVKYKVESLAKEGSSIYLSAGAGVDPSIYKDITDSKFKITASDSLTLNAVNDEWQTATFELDLSTLDSSYISAMGIHIICLGGVGETDSNTILVEGSSYNKIAIDYVEISCEVPSDEYIIGDVNGDGKIDTGDLALLKLCLAGVDNYVSAGADMNCDGNIDSADLASLKLYLVEN